MHAAEVGDLRGGPAGEAVVSGHRFEDPSVDRESLELTRAEEQDAVGHFFADAWQLQQARLGGRVGQKLGFIEPAGSRSQELGGRVDVACAKS